MITFEIFDKFNRKIILTQIRLGHILKRMEMANEMERIKETLLSPDEIRKSLQNDFIWLYYKHYSTTPVTEKYMVVVAKILNKEGYLLTAFYTDRIKKGEIVWKK